MRAIPRMNCIVYTCVVWPAAFSSLKKSLRAHGSHGSLPSKRPGAVLARKRESRRRQHNSFVLGCELQSEIKFKTDNLKGILLKAALQKIGRGEGKQNAM